MKKFTLTAVAVVALSAVGFAAFQDENNFGAQGVHADKTAVLVSGEGALVKGTATITLPAWFEQEAKTSNRTVQLTCKGGWSALWTSDVSNGQFTVSTDVLGNQGQAFYWQVLAEQVK